MSSYKLRMVPKDWEHPKKDNQYIPLLDGSYAEYSKKFDERKEMWDRGFDQECNFLDSKPVYNWVPKTQDCTFEEWDGEKSAPEDYRPDWTETECTHFQMYEDVSEGTPVSPVFEKVEDLAGWLARYLMDEHYPHTRKGWLKILTSSHPSVEMILVLPKIAI